MNVFLLLAIGAWGAITTLLGLVALGWYRQLRDTQKELNIYKTFLNHPLIAQFTQDQMAQLGAFIKETVQNSWINTSKVN